MEHFSKLIQWTIQNKADRQILIWGAWERGRQIETILRENSLLVTGYIDKVKHGGEYDGLPCFSPEELDIEKYYIIVSLVEHDSVLATLGKFGYKEYVDYCYPDKIIKIVQCKQSFCDNMGNSIQGTLSLDGSGSIVCMGGESSLIIHDGVKIAKNVTIYVDWNSRVEIGAGVTLADGCRISCTNNSSIFIGNHSVVRKNACVLAKNSSKIFIDKHVDIGHDTEIKIRNFNALHIGEHTLLSYYVMVRAGNGHSIVDLGKKNICNDRKDIYIGSYVWVCMRVTLLGGTYIDSHSIVGSNALVNKKFPSHVMLAGNPACIIREQVDWCMSDNITWEEYMESQNIGHSKISDMF